MSKFRKRCLIGLVILGWPASLALAYHLGAYYGFVDTVGASTSFGRFMGTPKTEWLDERDMQLLDDFVYIDPNQIAWLAPKGSMINGASIPRDLWSWIGSPFVGKYRNASIVHDVACDQKQRSHHQVHRMFFDACLAGGVPEPEAKRLYWAVARYGPRWELKAMFSVRASPDDEEGTEKTMVIVGKPLPSIKPAVNELQWAEAYFSDHDPTLEEIEEFSTGALPHE
mgnify:CR=1 FL=1